MRLHRLLGAPLPGSRCHTHAVRSDFQLMSEHSGCVPQLDPSREGEGVALLRSGAPPPPPSPRPAWDGTAVSPSLLSGHAFSTPILFFRGRLSCGEKGAKAKRKHPGRISHGGFPEHGRGRSRSGVGRQEWAWGLRGNPVAGGPRRAPGSCPELHRSSSPWERRPRVRIYQPRRESLAWVLS